MGGETISPNESLQLTVTPEFEKASSSKAHTLFGVATIKAPFFEPETRSGIDICIVLDRSGSMSGQPLELCKKTISFIIQQLQSKDKLSVVLYGSTVEVSFDLMEMNAEGKQKANALVEKFETNGCTNLSGGLFRGLDILTNRPEKEKNEVQTLLLLTDGHANEGLRDSQSILDAMKDPKKRGSVNCTQKKSSDSIDLSQVSMMGSASSILSSFRQQKTTQQKLNKGFETVSYDLTKGIEIEKSNVSLYTFGYSTGHDANFMKQISDCGRGMYYFIETADVISEAFASCLGGLVSVMAQNAYLTISALNGCTFDAIHSRNSFELSESKTKFVLNVGDVQSEEEKNIVFEITIPTLKEATSDSFVLATSELTYENVVTNSKETVRGNLTILRPLVVSDSEKEISNAIVDEQKNRIITAQAIEKATALGSSNDAKDHEEARKVLRFAKERVKKSSNSKSKRNVQYAADLEESESHVGLSKWSGFSNQMQQQHWNERATFGNANNVYTTSSRKNMKMKSKGYGGFGKS